jgi:hypothetical protein
MPPRRNTRSVAAAELATTALTSLPLSVVLHIFSLLPVDTRLRCAEVCRGWRSVLLERSLWTRQELTAPGSVTAGDADNDFKHWDTLLRCAAARAGGGLQSLRMDDTIHVSHAALLEVATANAGALCELRSNDFVGFTPTQAEAVLGAAPLLRVFSTDLRALSLLDKEAALRALRNEAHFGPLRVRLLHVNLASVDEAGIIAFAADVAAHASLTGLELLNASLGTPVALDAVVDTALARRMHTVSFYNCGLSSTSAPALARLLSSGALTTLEIVFLQELLHVRAAAVLAAALRANATLTSLSLCHTGVWRDPAVTAELLGALHGHASLRVLYLRDSVVEADDEAAVSAALGTLIAANAPALTQLDVSYCALGDDRARALFEALPHNTHLRTLDCSGNEISDAFAAGVLLPVVRANSSLRQLETGMTCQYAFDAEDLVHARTA